VTDDLAGTDTVTAQGLQPCTGHARSGDYYLATSGDLDLATSGDFFMATDNRRGDPRSWRYWCRRSTRPIPCSAELCE